MQKLAEHTCETGLPVFCRYIDVLSYISDYKRLHGPLTMNKDKTIRIFARLESAFSVYHFTQQTGQYFVIASNNLYPKTAQLRLLFSEKLSQAEKKEREYNLKAEPEYANAYNIFDKNLNAVSKAFKSLEELCEDKLNFDVNNQAIPRITNNHTKLSIGNKILSELRKLFSYCRELLRSFLKSGTNNLLSSVEKNNPQKLNIYLENCNNGLDILHITSSKPVRLENYFEYKKMRQTKIKTHLNKPFPQFKYIKSPIEEGIIVPSEDTCEVCEHPRGYVYKLGEEIICPWCIADGSAAKLLDIEFNYDDRNEVNKKNKTVLTKHTPAYPSWQDHDWPICCQDYSCFLSRLGRLEIEQLPEEAKKTITSYYNTTELPSKIEYFSKEHGPTGYLFQCLHCQKYNFFQDTD